MRRQRAHASPGMLLALLSAVAFPDAAAAEHCAWTDRNQRELHLALSALQDSDIAPRLRLWSLERQKG